jgi:hypothetical protein
MELDPRFRIILVRRMTTFSRVSRLSFSIIVAIALASCGDRSTNRIKQGSPLFEPAVRLDDREVWEKRIKDAILRQLPIGSEKAQIEAFIRDNFDGVSCGVTTTDDSRALAHIAKPHVFIRAIEDTGFPGECRVEIYLILGTDERLKEVIVKGIYGYV